MAVARGSCRPALVSLQLRWSESLTKSVQVVRPAGWAPRPQLSHLWRLFSPLTLASQPQPEGGQLPHCLQTSLHGPPASPPHMCPACAPPLPWLLPPCPPHRPAAVHPADRPRRPLQSLPVSLSAPRPLPPSSCGPDRAAAPGELRCPLTCASSVPLSVTLEKLTVGLVGLSTAL